MNLDLPPELAGIDESGRRCRAQRAEARRDGMVADRRRYLCWWALRFVHGGFDTSRLSRAHLGLYTAAELDRLKAGTAEDELLRRLARRVPEAQHKCAAGEFDPDTDPMVLWDPLVVEPDFDNLAPDLEYERQIFTAGYTPEKFRRLVRRCFSARVTAAVRAHQRRALAAGEAEREKPYDRLDWINDNFCCAMPGADPSL